MLHDDHQGILEAAKGLLPYPQLEYPPAVLTHPALSRLLRTVGGKRKDDKLIAKALDEDQGEVESGPGPTPKPYPHFDPDSNHNPNWEAEPTPPPTPRKFDMTQAPSYPAPALGCEPPTPKRRPSLPVCLSRTLVLT